MSVINRLQLVVKTGTKMMSIHPVIAGRRLPLVVALVGAEEETTAMLGDGGPAVLFVVGREGAGAVVVAFFIVLGANNAVVAFMVGDTVFGDIVTFNVYDVVGDIVGFSVVALVDGENEGVFVELFAVGAAVVGAVVEGAAVVGLVVVGALVVGAGRDGASEGESVGLGLTRHVSKVRVLPVPMTAPPGDTAGLVELLLLLSWQRSVIAPLSPNTLLQSNLTSTRPFPQSEGEHDAHATPPTVNSQVKVLLLFVSSMVCVSS